MPQKNIFNLLSLLLLLLSFSYSVKAGDYEQCSTALGGHHGVCTSLTPSYYMEGPGEINVFSSISEMLEMYNQFNLQYFNECLSIGTAICTLTTLSSPEPADFGLGPKSYNGIPLYHSILYTHFTKYSETGETSERRSGIVIHTRIACPTGYGLSSIGVGDDRDYLYTCFKRLKFYVTLPTPQPESCKNKDTEFNPCNPATGNKTQTEVDYQAATSTGLYFSRFYNSLYAEKTGLGNGIAWRHQFSKRVDEVSPSYVKVSEFGNGQRSSLYGSPYEACSQGWNQIKANYFGGNTSTTLAEYTSGFNCRVFDYSTNRAVTLTTFSLNCELDGVSFPCKNPSTDATITTSPIHSVSRPNGGVYTFQSTEGGSYNDPHNPSVSFVSTTNKWRLTDKNGAVELYDKETGQLLSITSRNGQTQTLNYQLSLVEGGDDNPDTLDRVTSTLGPTLNLFHNAEGLLSKVTTPDGDIEYSYDGNFNLVSVTYPDGGSKRYHYGNEQFPHFLTGITDENNNRFSTYDYNADGKVILSEHANGVERGELNYNADGTTTITDALGATRTYHFDLKRGYRRVTEVTGDRCVQCPNGMMQSRSYDENGFLSSYTDWNGNQTTLVNNDRGLPIQQTDAAGTSESRTKTTTWHDIFNLPVSITDSNRRTDLSYNVNGQLLSRTVTDLISNETRTTNYSYHPSGSNGAGLIASINGPHTQINDVSSFEYNTNGELVSLINALGHTTTFSDHDASGRPQQIVDANGQITRLSYTPRGWLKSRSQNGQSTVFDYDNVGQLRKLTLPDGSYTEYTYDAAHRLTDIADNLGNTIHYTLDAMGNRLKTELKDLNGSLTRLLEQKFNQLSQLQLSISGEGQITRFNYDLNGNPVASTDPRNTGSDLVAANAMDPLQTDNTRQSLYDALNRLIAVDNLQSNADNNDDINTTYEYNSLDQLVKVIDPNGLETTYIYNALGDLLQLKSPDTNITTYTYDKAGNRISQTDARNVTVNYTYDVLNRLISIHYPDTSLNVTYTYDENNTGQNGISRLTTVTDASGTTQYRYDKRGNLTAATVTRGTVMLSTLYAYNETDQLSQITYPSGRIVDYFYDTAGRIDEVTTTDTEGAIKTLLSNLEYQPFGPISNMLFGNNLTSEHSFDLDYRQTQINTSPAFDRSYSYDEANNITGIVNNLNIDHDQTYSYDGLSRLDEAQGLYGNLAYQYDKTGNRSQSSENGTTDYYTYPLDNHHLKDTNGSDQYKYDANGNTTHLPYASIFTDLVYGEHNRLTEVNEVTFTYNGRGERVKKDNGTVTWYYYDQSGQLIAETDASGNTQKEYLYLNSQLIALTEQTTANQAGNTEIILDNPMATFSDNWSVSTGVAGYQGSNYQYHAGGTARTPVVGIPIDNTDSRFSTTDSWTSSTSVSGYLNSNYQYHAGAIAGPLLVETPVDNSNSTFSVSGSWPTSSGVKGHQGANYRYHAAGRGNNTASWILTVPTTGNYDVYVNWTAHPNRASNAKYTVNHANGNDTVTVNQKQNGGQWQLLGTYTLNAATSHTIILSDDADGYVIADAVTLLPAGTPATGTPQGEIATWALNATTTDSYDVYTTWTAHTNRASDAKYTVNHANGSETITVNQKQNGGQWNLLGTFTLDNTSTVDLSSIANGYVIADAVTILPAGTPPTGTPQGETAIWQANLTGSHSYEIYAKWTAYPNRATDAKYTVHHASGSDIITVNQKQNGGQWNLLGTYTLDNTSSIQLSSEANGYVIADGIRLVNTTPTSATDRLYYVHNDHLSTPQVITDENQTIVWQAEYDPFGKATVTTETITNNIRFPGQYFDQETGLHYNYFRYYDPTTGRYITSDPIGLAGGLNTYAYVDGNPVNYTDSSGLFIDALADIGFITYDLFRLAADNVFGSCNNLGENLGALGADVGGLFIPGATGLGLGVRATKSGTAAIGRVKDLQNLKKGERSLLDRLSDQGSPKANWKQNSDVLRQEMSKGKPIRDVSPGDTRGQFLNAERNLLENRGWTFDKGSNYWNPPRQ